MEITAIAQQDLGSIAQLFIFIFLLTYKDSAAESFYLKRDYDRDDKLVLLRKKI